MLTIRLIGSHVPLCLWQIPLHHFSGAPHVLGNWVKWKQPTCWLSEKLHPAELEQCQMRFSANSTGSRLQRGQQIFTEAAPQLCLWFLHRKSQPWQPKALQTSSNAPTTAQHMLGSFTKQAMCTHIIPYRQPSPCHIIFLPTPRFILQKLRSSRFWKSSALQPLMRSPNVHRNVPNYGNKWLWRAAELLLQGRQSSCSELACLAQSCLWHCQERNVHREWLGQQPGYQL